VLQTVNAGTTSASGVLAFSSGSSNGGALLLPKPRPRSPALLPDHAAAAGRGCSLPAADVAGPRPSAADGPDASGLVCNGDMVVDSSLLEFEARYTVRDTGPAEGAVAAAAEATEAIAAEGDASVADELRLSDDETVLSFNGADGGFS
jgi:hypothetical protein